MLTPPHPEAAASFAFAPKPEAPSRVLLTVDTEEEFDWNGPFTRDRHGLHHVAAIPRFQQFCEEIGAYPVYLVDWPIACDPRAAEIIGDAVRRGKAEIGVQLHPWVNPPFDEAVNAANSYAGNLPGDLEAAKFCALRDKIEQAFGTAPLIYRAGRYGLGSDTAAILKAGGIAVDTSVRSLFDYRVQHGPDYSNHPLKPYWVDDERTLLELPVTTVYSGLLRRMGMQIHRLQRHMPTFFAGFSRLKLLERIALTPEGVTAKEAIKGIDIALGDQLPVLVLSFHSPSLAPGNTPYANAPEDVEALYDWFRQIYAHLGSLGVRSTTVAEIIAAAKR
ncbi:polysaccharide deacetylase family protein [Qipengyuania sp. ASV99]|uniref:polysaccharide deacetylase family protein n=1 Tax=Qipengyuania sp. ASV99 TaxID=3399681 RepID=UPI003A4C6E6E